TRICSRVNPAALTVMAGLVLAVLVLLVMSLAVRVWLPGVLKLTLKVVLPAVRAELAGKVAMLSDDVIPTVSVTFVTTFQLASTALTVRLKAVPAVVAPGVPVLPLAVPGEAVSPGTSNCSLVNDPAATAMEGERLAVMPA